MCNNKQKIFPYKWKTEFDSHKYEVVLLILA